MPALHVRTFPGSQGPLLLLVVLLVGSGGCRPLRDAPPPSPANALATLPTPLGYTRYQVVPSESEVRVLVYRDGPMARLGHNHVISSQALEGEIFVGDKTQPVQVSLVLPLASLSVDQPGLRAAEGGEFSGPVTENGIAGTRANMLSERLLSADLFPEIRLTGQAVPDQGTTRTHTLTVVVAVRGELHPLTVPAEVIWMPTGFLATGEFSVTHGQLGLTPYRAIGGLIRVKDEIRIRFRLRAR